jgi:Leucine-rich repeat
MEDIIKTQLPDSDPEEVFELILDKWRGSTISVSDKSLLELYPNLEVLSMTGCGLKSLENFPSLPNLLKLELCDNKIKGSLKPLSNLPSLTMLSLAGNQIHSFEELADIECLSNLVSLDLYGCPITALNEYNLKVFGMFTSLQVLDGKNKDGEEVSVASEEDDSEESEDDLSSFIEDDQSLKRRRDSEESNDPENKKIPPDI